MKILKRSVSILSVVALCATASAHIVGITWNLLPNGDVKFDALHWHGNTTVAGIGSAALTLNGTNYGFTSVTNDVTSMPGIGGLDNNPAYSIWNGTTLTATLNNGANDGGEINDWLHVTVPASAFLPTGQTNTLDSTPGPGQLSEWTLSGGITSIGIVLPPPPTGTVPDSGSSVLVFGLGLGLIAGLRRFFAGK